MKLKGEDISAWPNLIAALIPTLWVTMSTGHFLPTGDGMGNGGTALIVAFALSMPAEITSYWLAERIGLRTAEEGFPPFHIRFGAILLGYAILLAALLIVGVAVKSLPSGTGSATPRTGEPPPEYYQPR